MRREFYLTLDLQLLAIRLAWVSALRVFWRWLLAGDISTALVGLWPNPSTIFSNFYNGLTAAFSGWVGGSIGVLVDALFSLMQLGLIIGLILWAVERFRPDISAKVPLLFGHKKEEDGILHAARLRRPWWMMPVILTFSVIVTLYVISGWFVMGSGNSYRASPRSLEAAMSHIGLVPLYIGLALGALGLIWGYRFNASAAATIGGMFNIRELPNEHPLTLRVHALAKKLELPLPKVAVTEAVNAFAVGTSIKQAMVVIGAPLVRNLNTDELDAVIGHELGHIISGDMRQMQFAEGYQQMFGDVFYGLGQFVGFVGAAMAQQRSTAALSRVFADLFSMLGRAILNLGGEVAVKGLSRSREYYADAIGAALTSPAAMAGALEKLQKIPTEPTEAETQYAYLMFKGGSLRWIFSTHPDTEKRKQALEKRTHLRLLPMRRAKAG